MKTRTGHASPADTGVSRRQFLRASLWTVAGAATSAQLPFVVTSPAAPDGLIRIGLIGCGARGLGAAVDALQAAPSVQVVALADAFPDRVQRCREQLARWRQDVSPESCFMGFDAYRKLAALPKVNYVIHATPPGFRPRHLRAIVEAGKSVFMEAPVAADPPGVRSIIETGELAGRRGLSIVCGTQRRHQRNYRETIRRLQEGALGQLTSASIFTSGPGRRSLRPPSGLADLEHQLRRWRDFAWLSGGLWVAQQVHGIDVINWILNMHPAQARPVGGDAESSRSPAETPSMVSYEYSVGFCLFSVHRRTAGSPPGSGEIVRGMSGESDCCQTIRLDSGAVWRFSKDSVPVRAIHSGSDRSGYVHEHAALIHAIRTGQPINEARQGALSTMSAILGCLAAGTGQTVDWDTAWNAGFDSRATRWAGEEWPAFPGLQPKEFPFS